MADYLKKIKKYLELAYGRFQVAKHGFWFIDIPRTSSSSIHSELGKHFGKAYGKNNVIERELATPQIFADHTPARVMRNLLGEKIWESIFTFTIVRNPWDRTFSMYNHRKKLGNIPAGWSFRDYVLGLEKSCGNSIYFKYYGFRYGASEYVLGENGKVIVDFIARYENRKHDINLIASRIKCDTLGTLHTQRATPKNQHYSQFYDAESREIIRRLYLKDIELFEYDFESIT